MISPEFRRAYVRALGRHVRGGNEASLRDGYEIGRRAVAEGCSALELAAIHHDALAASIPSPSNEAANVVASAAAFFQESLSAFEMLHRGYHEAASAAAAERRAAAMLRRLSSFLADASLSAWHTEADSEVLHLVAETARELTDAAHVSAKWTGFGRDVRARSMDASSPDHADDLLDRLERFGDDLPARVSRSGWAAESALRGLQTSNLLHVPLTTLGGTRAGTLQLVGKSTGDFTDADEAVAVHLAEITAAALERAQLYRETART